MANNKTKFRITEEKRRVLIVEDEIINQETKEVFARYDTFCHENGFTKVAMQTFSKEITRLMDCKIVDKKIKGRKCRIFVYEE